MKLVQVVKPIPSNPSAEINTPTARQFEVVAEFGNVPDAIDAISDDTGPPKRGGKLVKGVRVNVQNRDVVTLSVEHGGQLDTHSAAAHDYGLHATQPSAAE